LMKAVELLVSGYSMKEVAFKMGYRHSSAFIEMFRHTFGTTPKAWILALGKISKTFQPQSELASTTQPQEEKTKETHGPIHTNRLAQTRDRSEAFRENPCCLVTASAAYSAAHGDGSESDRYALGGGLPIGGISELTGLTSSGRTSLAFSILSQVSLEPACAYIDVSDVLYVQSAAAAGIFLGNLLWVRVTSGEARAAPTPDRSPSRARHHKRRIGKSVRVAAGITRERKPRLFRMRWGECSRTRQSAA